MRGAEGAGGGAGDVTGHACSVALLVRRPDRVATGSSKGLDESATARCALRPVSKAIARCVDHHLVFAVRVARLLELRIAVGFKFHLRNGLKP